MPTLEVERAPRLEVTAVGPTSGLKKLLAREELNHLFTLLTGYEEALGQDNGEGGGRTETLRNLSADFKVFGVDIDWFSERVRDDQPLFIARYGPFEKTGYRLKDLLGIARQTGILDAAPQPPVNSASPLEDPGAKRVFIVDDDESVRDMLAFAVRGDGFQVESFADGISMLQNFQGAASDYMPDLILLDLMLPTQSGYEILRRLQVGRTKRIPVIVITGRQIDRDMSSIMRQEANLHEFIQKPIYPKVLLATIHKLLKTTAPVKVAVA